jgi:hypothetical protein
MRFKTSLLLPIISCSFAVSSAQKQDISAAAMYYQVSGLVYVYNYDVSKRTQLNTFKIPKSSLKFEVVRKERNDTALYEFVIIKFLPIVNDIVSDAGVKMSLNNNVQFLNSEDNKKYFWIRQDELNTMVEEKTIRKRFKLSHGISYGANIFLPLKLRPQMDVHNARFSPDISFGGFLGFKHRISRKEPFYVSLPHINLGLATLPITAETDGATPHKGDGIVLGITGSAGVVFQLKDFQLGFLAGRDKAVGEIGKSWIYNNKTWYAFSVGYSFLGNNRQQE